MIGAHWGGELLSARVRGGRVLLLEAGFLVEAILRDEACDLEGRRVDVYRMAITEGEWAG